MNLVKETDNYEREIFKIEGPLGKTIITTDPVDKGQVLAYIESTGKVAKYVKGDAAKGIAFSIAMDSALANKKVLIAIPGTKLNKTLIKGADLSTDFKVEGDLFRSNILLEEVR